MNHQEICDAIAVSFIKQFPNSNINVSISHNLGTCLYVKFTLGANREEYANKIIQNDPMFQVITVDGLTKEGFSSKLTIEGGSGVDIKDPNPAYYCKRVKVFRKASVDTPEKVVKKLDGYFKKLKQTVIDNADQIQPLVRDLYSVNSKVDA